jgi:hypothetical protein
MKVSGQHDAPSALPEEKEGHSCLESESEQEYYVYYQ